MPRPDERGRRRAERDAGPAFDADAATAGMPASALPSKTHRKAEMHALQEMGVALVRLDPRRFAELAAATALPERLIEAIVAARSITAWGGRKRQLQYVGRLMRDVDPEPIRRQLELWAHARDSGAARARDLERWRERLVAEPGTLDALSQAFPRLDRPRFRALIAKARDERVRGGPPHAYRELFRALKALDGTD